MAPDDGGSHIYAWVRAPHLLDGFIEYSSGIGLRGVLGG
jgi:hypothetical protein